MFISGIQPPAYVINIERHGTETVDATNKVIHHYLPNFQAIVNMGGYTSNAKTVELTIMATPQKSIRAMTGGQKCHPLQKGPQAKAMAAVVSTSANTAMADLTATVASLAATIAG